MVKMKMIAGLVVLCLASAVAAFFLPRYAALLREHGSRCRRWRSGHRVFRAAAHTAPCVLIQALPPERPVPRYTPKAQGAPSVLPALFVVPLLAATTQEHRAVPMAQPYVYHRPRIKSRMRPMTVSSTPPSSIASATFHTSRRSFFPAWGSCM